MLLPLLAILPFSLNAQADNAKKLDVAFTDTSMLLEVEPQPEPDGTHDLLLQIHTTGAWEDLVTINDKTEDGHDVLWVAAIIERPEKDRALFRAVAKPKP